jgi:hypothetical protein
MLINRIRETGAKNKLKIGQISSSRDIDFLGQVRNVILQLLFIMLVYAIEECGIK